MLIRKNWFMLDYAYPAAGMSYCKNTTANNNWCKSKEEIEDFLRDTPEYFVHMHTLVQEDIFKDHSLIEQFPYNGDRENYFPTVQQMGSIDYGKTNVDASTRDTEFKIIDISA